MGEAQRQHYSRNRDAMVAKARAYSDAHRVETRAFIQRLKETRPCADCGGTFPAVCMDFDHRHGSKTLNVADAVNRGWGWERLIAEIQKCDIVCANCHRVRTASDRTAKVPITLSGVEQ